MPRASGWSDCRASSPTPIRSGMRGAKPPQQWSMTPSPESVAQVHESLQVGQEETPEKRRAHHRPILGAEIVADEKDVDGSPGGFEDPAADLVVIIDDAAQKEVYEFGRIVEEHHEAFHAQEVDGVVIKG